MKLVLNLKNETKTNIKRNECEKKALKLLQNKLETDILEVNITLVAPPEIVRLKSRYLKRDKDRKEKLPSVLSFPIWKNPLKLKNKEVIYLGEIVICPRNAKINSQDIYFLFEHGLKHLIGIHHN